MSHIRKLLIDAIVLVMAFACLTSALFHFMPWIERNFFPVVTKLHITQVTDAPGAAGHSYVWVSYTKMRSCEYVDTSWYRRSTDGGLTRVYLNLRPSRAGAPKTRPLGLQFSGPWDVDIPPDRLREESVVELQHRCWGPLWLTTTHWYP